jgi:hypothetical protein
LVLPVVTSGMTEASATLSPVADVVAGQLRGVGQRRRIQLVGPPTVPQCRPRRDRAAQVDGGDEAVQVLRRGEHPRVDQRTGVGVGRADEVAAARAGARKR